MMDCNSQRGFTLLEVLIAISLMAVLSVLSWRALDSTARSHEQLEAGTDQTVALLRALGQLETDLAQHATGAALAVGMQKAEHSAPAIRASLEGVLPAGIQWKASELTIIRGTHEGAWQQIVWSQAGDRLTRATGTPSVGLPLPPAGHPETMLRGVQGFMLRPWLPGQGWADSATDTSLPATGLEVSIAQQSGPASHIYRKVVLLP